MTRQAILAGAAAGMKPGDAHAVSDGSNGTAYTRADGDNYAGTFVSGNERELGGRRPVAIDGVNVGLVVGNGKG